MSDALITTVIPTYRRPILLKRAIQSVLAQSFKDLVVCVYDNASGDETESIVREFAERDSRVIYHRNATNIGGGPNVLQGLSAVTTPFYSLLSDDDFLLPGFYESAIEAFNARPDIAFVCSKTLVLDLIARKIQFRNQDWAAGFYEPSNDTISKMHASHFVTTGVLLSRRVMDDIGLFEPSGSDMLYMTIAAGTFPFAVLDQYGAAITLHEGAYSVVGQGLTKESISRLSNDLVSSIENVVKLNVPADRKVHLIVHTIKTYQELSDTKQLNYLMNANGDLESAPLVPSLMTKRGLVIKSYDLVPRMAHSLVTASYRLTRFLKSMALQRADGAWVALPDNAFALVNGSDSDVSELMSHLPQTRAHQK